MNKTINKHNIVMVIAIFLLSAMSFAGKASHLIGGQITYTFVSGSTYNVRLALYRDCDGIALGTTAGVSVVNSSNSIISNLTLNQISVTDRTILCPGQVSNCANPASTIDGVEEHIYTGNVTLPTAVANYNIVYSVCCRPSGVDNLLNPGNQDLYLSTLLRHDPLLHNNSPVFTNPAIGKFCTNQLGSVSLNGFDPDGDVLVYSLVNARKGTVLAPSSVDYAAGFSGVNPLSSSSAITINSSTGQMSFTPTVVNQRAVVAIRLEEFRAGVKIGEIYRDFEVTAISCTSNTTPVIGALPNVTVQAGQTYCVPVIATDADNDLTSLNASSGIIPPGTFIVNSTNPGTTNATFCFTPTAAMAGQTFAVSINANDNHCPQPATAVSTFTITVPPANGVPTISEWGLVLLCLSFLSFGMVFIYKKENAFAFAGGSEMNSSNKASLFNMALYMKVLAATLAIAVAGLFASYFYYSSITVTDTIGTVMSAAIVAYMAHLFILLRKNESKS